MGTYRQLIPHRRWGIVAWASGLLVLASCGCASVGRKQTMGQDVIIGRQLAQQGADALHEGRYHDAEAHFREAIGYCPANTDARYQLANCLWKRGETEEAILQLEQALRLAGGRDVEMLVELGYMQANVDRLQAAGDLAERAIQLEPDYAVAWQLRGDVQRERGHWESALGSYQRSLAYDPENVEVQLACAHTYAQLNRPQRVVATLQQIEDKLGEADRPESMLVLKSRALAALERNDEAVSVLAQAAAQRQLSRVGLAALAEAQLANDQWQEAAQTLRVALRDANPREEVALRRLMGQALAMRGSQLPARHR